MFLKNTGVFVPDYMALLPRRLFMSVIQLMHSIIQPVTQDLHPSTTQI
jgi:hypothetical protein